MTRKVVLGDGIWLLVANAINIAGSLLVGMFIAKHLGVKDFGVLSLLTITVSLISVISSFGIESILVKRLIETQNHFLIWVALVARVAAWAVIQVFVLIFVFTKATELRFVVLVLSLFTIFDSLKVLELYFQSENKFKIVTRCQLIISFFTIALKLLLLYFGATLMYFVSLIALEKVLTALVLCYAFVRDQSVKHYSRVSVTADLRMIIRDAAPLFLSGLLVFGYMKVDQFMIAGMLGVSELGIYSAAIRIVEAVLFVPVTIGAVFFPTIMKAKHGGDRDKYETLLQFLYDGTVLIASIFILFILLLTPVYIWVLGSDFEQARGIIYIYLIGILAIFFNAINKKVYVAENLNKILLFRTLAGFFLNAILNTVLISLFGLKGAAISTVLTYYSIAFISNRLVSELAFLWKIQIRSMNLPKNMRRLYRNVNEYIHARP